MIINEEFILKLKNGDNKAWIEFDSIFIRKLNSKIYSMGVVNELDREDLLNDLKIAVFEALISDKYEEHGKFNAWINTILGNITKSYFKNKKKMPLSDINTSELRAFNIDQTDNEHLKYYINRCLKKLKRRNEKWYEMIILRYVVEMERLYDIAIRMGEELNNVKALHKRAKDLLKKCLKVNKIR